MSKHIKLLVIGQTWPEPTATAAGCRMIQLLRCFLEAGYEIRFATTAREAETTHSLQALGIGPYRIQLNHSAFDSWIGDWMPDLVLFDRFMTEEQFGWRVARACPGAIRILDTEDLHSLRVCREAAMASGREFSLPDWRRHTTTLRELASIYRCDLSLIISSYEMELLSETAGVDDALLGYLPFMYEPVSLETVPTFEERSGYVFLGNGRHRPNVDAVKWLRKVLWPGIRSEQPQAELHVYGAYLPGSLLEMHCPDLGFHVKGRVDDAHKVLQNARIQLAPLRYGAGIKGKLADSMRCGTPSVTTPIGAEGMHGDLAWNGVVAETPKAIIASAVDLYHNRERWTVAHEQGAEIINRLYSKTKLAAGLLLRIEHIRGKLKAHRDRNLIGAMMMHHRMASTMYLGKWIEAKNHGLASRGADN